MSSFISQQTFMEKIKPVNPKGNQLWIFIGRTDAEAETPILWPPDMKNWLIGKDLDAGNDWKQEEKGQQRSKWLDGISDSMDMSLHNPGSWQWTESCSPWSCKESDTTEQLNWTETLGFRTKRWILIKIIHI